jgi:hypothetical protein
MKKTLLISFLLVACANEQSADSIDKLMFQTANKVNKNLPIMIDQYTRLDATMPIPGKKFMYLYTITNFSKDDLSNSDIDDIKNGIKTTVKNAWASGEDFKIFRKYYIDIIYKYRDMNGFFLFEFAFNAGTL